METILLGPSDLRVSRLGFGCWQLGGHGWQGIDQAAIVQAAHRALERGVNFFDTADAYGLGASETLLGEALRTSAAGKKAVVATKFGVRRENGATVYDNSPAWMKEALEASLKRLGRDVIDLYQLHWPDKKRPLHDVLGDLETFRAAGKIRWYGVCNVAPQELARVSAFPGLVSLSAEWSLLKREREAATRQLQQSKNLTFIAWGALAQGLLSGKYGREDRFADGDIRSRTDSRFAESRWDEYERVLKVLQEAAQHHQHSMAQVALRWLLDRPPAAVVLTGIKNAAQLEENTGADGWQLDAKWIEALDAVTAPRTEGHAAHG